MAGKFAATKRVSLATTGTGWDSAYVEITLPTYKEARVISTQKVGDSPEEQMAFAELVLKFMKDHFVGGKAPSNGVIVDINVDDLEELPINALAQVRESLLGQDVLSPNS